MKLSVLFICLGNICRSPAGEEILRQMASQEQQVKVEVASCGLGSWHAGELPDSRMRAAAKKRGYNLQSRAQSFQRQYFEQYDYLLAADRSVLDELKKLASKDEHLKKLFLINDFSLSFQNLDIPDPYYKGDEGFEEVLDMLEEACAGFIGKVQSHV